MDASANSAFNIENIGANYASFQVSGFNLTYDGTGDGRAFTWQGSNAVENKVFTASDITMNGITSHGQNLFGDLDGWAAFSNIEYLGYRLNGTFLVGGKSLSFIGMKMQHLPTQGSHNIETFVENGIGGGGGFGLRTSGGSELFYLSQCDFFQRQGWFENAPGIADVQAWLRLDMDDTKRVVIERCMSENGFNAIAHENKGDGPHNNNLLIEKCLFIGQNDTTAFFEADCPMTVRNCIFIVPPSKTLRHSFNRFIDGVPPVGSFHKTLQ